MSERERRAIELLNRRLEEEKKSEALALERAEAEARAAALLQARIAAEEALARKSADAAEAARRAAQAQTERAEREEVLRLAAMARIEAENEARNAAEEQARAEARAAEAMRERIAAEALLGRNKVEAPVHEKPRAADSSQRRATPETDARFPARRWPVLLAVASAVLLSLLLGLYIGWRQPDTPLPAVESGQEPLKLKLEHRLEPRGPARGK